MSGLSLEEVERVSGENDTLISTKTRPRCWLEHSSFNQILTTLTSWQETPRLSQVITGLTNCLLEADIFDGDLEFTLSTQDIQALFDTYNQLKTSEYPGLLSSNLGNEGRKHCQAVRQFDQINWGPRSA